MIMFHVNLPGCKKLTLGKRGEFPLVAVDKRPRGPPAVFKNPGGIDAHYLDIIGVSVQSHHLFRGKPLNFGGKNQSD